MQVGPVEAAQRARAVELRSKFYSGKAIQKKDRVLLPAPQKPEWRSKECWFNQHVISYRVGLAFFERIKSFNTATEVHVGEPPESKRTMMEITKEILLQHPSMSFADIRGRRRTKAVVKVRHEIVRAIVKERPDLSFPAIGRFMHKDHTSILSAAGNLKRKPTTWE